MQKQANTPISTLGILGGLGPASGVLFCDMLTRHTLAERDQDHLNFILSSRADTPDRTAFILGRSEENPAPSMIREVERLVAAGADIIAIPCNTAHYFYESVKTASPVPIINIIDQTVDYCRFTGARRIGVLATEGTISSGAYKTVIEGAGLEYIVCSEDEQAVINTIIYGEIKKGLRPSVDAFMAVAESLQKKGCDKLILGCTELSLLREATALDQRFVDSLEVLALSAIKLCGKTACGFSPSLQNFVPRKDIAYAIK